LKTSPQFRHGLVIGKFFPPHSGHLFLIRSAAALSESLTVGVFDRESSLLPLALREEAMREELSAFSNIRYVHKLDPHRIDYDDPSVWDAHVSVFVEGVKEALSREGKTLESLPVDGLFTSEDYGEELSRRLGCIHVCLDHPRSWEPLSATAVRKDIVSHWLFLPPRIRSALSKRIVVVGAESSGTSTIAQTLWGELRKRGGIWERTELVREFGREHSLAKLSLAHSLARHGGCPLPSMESLTWESSDFFHIARMQHLWESEAASRSGLITICDTDLLATRLWHERYVGKLPPDLDSILRPEPPRSLYILTDHEGVPFENDGLRDGEHIRSWMTSRFEEVLAQSGVPWIKVSGSISRRVSRAIQAVEQVISEGWQF